MFTPFVGGGGIPSAPVTLDPLETSLVQAPVDTELRLESTPPEAGPGATKVGKAVEITAAPAVASTDTAGAAAGGSVTITAGDAARLTSGNANGGDVSLVFGAGIGTGVKGGLNLTGTDAWKITAPSGHMNFFSVFDRFRIDSNGYGIKVPGSANAGYAWSASGVDMSGQDTSLVRASAGRVNLTDGASGIRGFLGGGASIASAAALPVPTGRVCHVTGTTTITSITSTNLQSGVVVTLIFDGALTVTDGGNLKLAGDFVTTADDTLTLVYDGTNWYETGRSVN